MPARGATTYHSCSRIQGIMLMCTLKKHFKALPSDPRLATAATLLATLICCSANPDCHLPSCPGLMQEWDTFLLCLKKPLPITFRINGQGKFADRLVAQLESNFLKQFTEEPVVVSRHPWLEVGVPSLCCSAGNKRHGL